MANTWQYFLAANVLGLQVVLGLLQMMKFDPPSWQIHGKLFGSQCIRVTSSVVLHMVKCDPRHGKCMAIWQPT